MGNCLVCSRTVIHKPTVLTYEAAPVSGLSATIEVGSYYYWFSKSSYDLNPPLLSSGGEQLFYDASWSGTYCEAAGIFLATGTRATWNSGGSVTVRKLIFS